MVQVVDLKIRPSAGGSTGVPAGAPLQDLTMDMVRGGPDGSAGPEAETGLETAVLASLFTWRRADPDDVIPAGDDDRQGWWGDSYPFVEGDRWGSKLWLLHREVLTDLTVARARRYAEEALSWLVEDRIADRVIVRAARGGSPVRLNIAIAVIRGDRTLLSRRFLGLWDRFEMNPDGE